MDVPCDEWSLRTWRQAFRENPAEQVEWQMANGRVEGSVKRDIPGCLSSFFHELRDFVI